MNSDVCRFNGMEAMYGRDIVNQTQLRFSLNRANHIPRPDTLPPGHMRPYPPPKCQMGEILSPNSSNQPVSAFGISHITRQMV